MSDLFTVTEGRPEQREAITEWLPMMSRLSAATRSSVVTAWTTVWNSSGFATIADFPYAHDVGDYRLREHVVEVVEVGLLLVGYARERWNYQLTDEIVLPTLILHDVDKPLLYVRQPDGTVTLHPHRSRIQHGVLGAMLLRDLGFADDVVAPVAAHAANSPFHDPTPVGWILHYADFFCADHAFRDHTPFFQRN
ncbi:MAG: hypothetical protein QOH87_2946 [Trebonia sp.]|jgi:putative nucleotidyltransferase with HDIG domain|nr:hypothetical protein [Trebonia sp.]MDX6391064.1 hypothetical protein [Streptosporangiaceae bacterium]